MARGAHVRGFAAFGSVALAAWACACTDGSDVAAGTSNFTVRDSAGIEIVENTGPAWGEGEGWTIDPDPVLRIGAIDGEPWETFAGISGLFRDGQGRIVVLDSGSHELRFFDSAGGFLHSMGGAGEGPGEFQMLFDPPRRAFLRAEALNRWRRDTILVHSNRSATQYVLNQDGAEVRRVRARELRSWTYGFPGEDRLLLQTSTGEPDAPDSHEWQHIYVASLGPDASTDTIGAFPIFPVDQTLRFSPYGYQIPIRGGFASVRTDRPELREYDWDGTERRIIRWPLQPEAVPDPARAASTRPASEFFPLLGEVRAHADGSYWIARYGANPLEGPVRLSVVTDAGQYLGEIETPARFSTAEVGPDYVLGVQLDEFDVEYVVMYRLRRGE